jgi:hypothetical protein
MRSREERRREKLEKEFSPKWAAIDTEIERGRESELGFKLRVNPDEAPRIKSQDLRPGDVIYDFKGYFSGVITESYEDLGWWVAHYSDWSGESSVKASWSFDVMVLADASKRFPKPNLGRELASELITIRGEFLTKEANVPGIDQEFRFEIHEFGVKVSEWFQRPRIFMFSSDTRVDFESHGGPDLFSHLDEWAGDWAFDVEITDPAWSLEFKAVGHSEKAKVARLKKLITRQVQLLANLQVEQPRRVSETAETLVKLAELLQAGTLTQAEFEKLKRSALGQL